MKKIFIALLLSFSFVCSAIALDSDTGIVDYEQVEFSELCEAPDFDVLKITEYRSYTVSGCAIHAIDDQDHGAYNIGSGSGDAYAAQPFEVGWRSFNA